MNLSQDPFGMASCWLFLPIMYVQYNSVVIMTLKRENCPEITCWIGNENARPIVAFGNIKMHKKDIVTPLG